MDVLLAAEREEAGQTRDVEDVDEAVGRVGGDVLARGAGGDGDGKVSGDERDIEDVGVSVVVKVGGSGVGAAVNEGVSAG